MRWFSLVVCFVVVASGLAEAVQWLPSDIRLDTDTPGDSTSDDVAIAAAGDTVYVVWSDKRNGNEDIFVNVSFDRGITWRVNDRRLNTNGAGASRSLSPRVAAAGDNVCVVWMDNRNSSLDIFANCAQDGGITWQTTDRRIDTDAPGAEWSYNPMVAMDGDDVYVVWPDSRSSGFSSMDLYLNRSSDGGLSWQATDLRIDSGTGDIYEITLKADGVYVWLSWLERRTDDSGQRVYFNASWDRGVTWMPSDVSVDHALNGDCIAPRMATSGSTVYLTWGHYYSASDRVYLNTSLDGGATWQSSDTLIDFGGNPAIAAFDDWLYLGFMIVDQFVMVTSPDLGVSWPWPQAVVRSYNVNDFGPVWVEAGGTGVYALWEDQRCLDLSIAFNWSFDHGKTFNANGVFLNNTACTLTALADEPGMAITGERIYVVWPEARTGLKDVFFNVGELPVIFADGFEGGSTTAWSFTQP